MTTNAKAVKKAVEKARTKREVVHKAGKNRTVQYRPNDKEFPFAGMEYRFKLYDQLVATFDVPTSTWTFCDCGWPTLTTARFMKEACSALDFNAKVSFAKRRFTIKLIDRNWRKHTVSGDLGDTLSFTEREW